MKFKKKYMLLILIVMITGLLFISKSKITAEDYYVIGNFEEAIRVNPNHYKALYGYIEELELDKEYKKAEIYTLKYIHNYPYDIKGYEKLVDIYIFLNKYDKIKDIENMLKDVKITERAYRLKRVPDLNLKKYIEEKERKNKNVR
jgi:tetratricopeptide (TPR) repeat protein